MSDKTATEKFRGRRIAVIGDLVADQFLDGTIQRVSREAPVFILRHNDTVTLPGAAANAAANVATLCGTPLLCGLVGEDDNGAGLIESLTRSGVDITGVVRCAEKATTTKVRVLAGQHFGASQQVIRIDYESNATPSGEESRRLVDALTQAIAEADAVIVSDYGCGSVTDEAYGAALTAAGERGIPIVVDSRHRLASFAGATAATPNREEVESIAGPDFSADDCERLRRSLGYKALLVTNGNKGMTLFSDANRGLVIEAVGSPVPVDVTGAGDTVIAAFTLGLAAGMDFEEAARIANHAGGIVVMKKRTATLTPAELEASLAAVGSARGA